MNCKCGSDRIMYISGHCVDSFSASYEDINYDGYVPSGLGIGSGDDMDLSICMDCGKVAGEFPVPDEKVRKQLSRD